MRLEGVRLRNLLEALQICIVVGERESLLGAVRTNGRDPNVAAAGQISGLAADPPTWRSALFEDFNRQSAAGERDDLRRVVLMVIVFFILLAPRAPDHPSGDAENDHGGRQLQVGFAASAREILTEVEAEKRHGPYDRGMRNRDRPRSTAWKMVPLIATMKAAIIVFEWPGSSPCSAPRRTTLGTNSHA
ncbi:hypothetical protein ABIB68_007763 [Bradyrhizobium sp. F1.2.2]